VALEPETGGAGNFWWGSSQSAIEPLFWRAHMRIYSIVSAAVSGVLMAGVSTLAFAGSCANGMNCDARYNNAPVSYESAPSTLCRTRLTANSRVNTCSTRSVVYPVVAAPLAPINYYNSVPYGYLKTFAYKNTPDVNIMRVYARAPMSPLNYVPVRFSGGCNTVATASCGTRAVTAAPAPILPAAPLAPVQFRTSNTVVAGNVIGHVSGGSYTYTKPGTPDYWEKTSGATMVGGLPATQIVCRRAGTAATSQTVNVIRPVIGVPQPVPTPVPYCLPTPGLVALNGLPMAGGRWSQ